MRVFLAFAILWAGTAASLGETGAAAKSSSDPVVTERISSADLNLRRIADQTRLRARIAFAAYRLCLADAPASPSPAIADPQCQRGAMTSALQQMDHMIALAAGDPSLASSSSTGNR